MVDSREAVDKFLEDRIWPSSVFAADDVREFMDEFAEEVREAAIEECAVLAERDSRPIADALRGVRGDKDA